ICHLMVGIAGAVTLCAAGKSIEFSIHRSHICDSDNTNGARVGTRDAFEGGKSVVRVEIYPALRRLVLSPFRGPRLLACSTLSRSRCMMSITLPRCSRGAAGMAVSTTLVLP